LIAVVLPGAEDASAKAVPGEEAGQLPISM